jgi:hypothetical protein
VSAEKKIKRRAWRRCKTFFFVADEQTKKAVLVWGHIHITSFSLQLKNGPNTLEASLFSLL